MTPSKMTDKSYMVRLDTDKIGEFFKSSSKTYTAFAKTINRHPNYVYQRMKYKTMNKADYMSLCEFANVSYTTFSIDGKDVFNKKMEPVRVGRPIGKVRIDGMKLKKFLRRSIKPYENDKMYFTRLSHLCGKSDSYLTAAISNETIDKKVLQRLGDIYTFDPNTFIINDVEHREIDDPAYKQMLIRKYLTEIEFRIKKLKEIL